MTRGINKGDLIVRICFEGEGTDGLGDGAELFVDTCGVSERVKQGRLSMIDMPHYGNHRGTLHKYLLSLRLIFNEFNFFIKFQSQSLYGILGEDLKLVRVWFPTQQLLEALQ